MFGEDKQLIESARLYLRLLQAKKNGYDIPGREDSYRSFVESTLSHSKISHADANRICEALHNVSERYNFRSNQIDQGVMAALNAAQVTEGRNETPFGEAAYARARRNSLGLAYARPRAIATPEDSTALNGLDYHDNNRNAYQRLEGLKQLLDGNASNDGEGIFAVLGYPSDVTRIVPTADATRMVAAMRHALDPAMLQGGVDNQEMDTIASALRHANVSSSAQAPSRTEALRMIREMQADLSNMDNRGDIKYNRELPQYSAPMIPNKYVDHPYRPRN